mgnify:CR=1 FL=1
MKSEQISKNQKIEKQNMEISHFIWIVFVSMITSIITAILVTM